MNITRPKKKEIKRKERKRKERKENVGEEEGGERESAYNHQHATLARLETMMRDIRIDKLLSLGQSDNSTNITYFLVLEAINIIIP